MKTSRETGLHIFISVHNILNIPNNPPEYQFNECLERLKGGVPLRSLLGSPDPTKIQYIQDPETGETKANMTEEKAGHARHIRQLDEKRKDRERREGELRERDLALDLTSNSSNTPCDNNNPLSDNSTTPRDYSIPLSKKNLNFVLKTIGLTHYKDLRSMSTRDLNILAKWKGLSRELIREAKAERRRLEREEDLKRRRFGRDRVIDERDEEAVNEERIELVARLAQRRVGDAVNYSVENIRREVSALREWMEAAKQQFSYSHKKFSALKRR